MMNFRNSFAVTLSFALTLLLSCETKQKEINVELINDVDPFIGTGGHGHTYPGATVPFGMLQVSPDNGISGWDWCSGYHYSDSITIGFSHLHLSGTGIGDLTDIRFMPVNKKLDLTQKATHRDNLPYKSKYQHKHETAKPGYYSVFLDDYGVKAELTSTTRTAFHQYTYQENDDQSVVIDLGFAINWDKSLETEIHIEDKFTVSGYRYSTGWAKNQKVYFVAKFSKSINNYDLVSDNQYVKGNRAVGERTTAQLFFNDLSKQNLQIKVGVSSVSVDNAKDNIKDYTGEFEFDFIVQQTQLNWEENLRKIVVETPVDSLKTIFYTALYHAQLAPVIFSDRNGEFRLENDSIAKAQNFTAYSSLSLWDTFRAQNPLLTVINPDLVGDLIQSMLAYYQVNKVLPVWVLYGNETNTMTGYHSIPVIAEAILKGIVTTNRSELYQAIKNTLMQDERGLESYKTYGYIPYDQLDESVTITLELAYNDWCAAQVAQQLGYHEDYEYFLKRSNAYQYLFDKDTGFMRGKSSDGSSWKEPFDPKFSAHRVHAEYTEGNAWQHSWFVLHDVPQLMMLHGGEANFTNKLEQLFTESSEISGDNVSPDISGLVGQYAHGNEPSHHIAYMFNYAQQPWRTQFWVNQILKSQYNTTPNGLSGNEDCGQMSAWYVFSAIGLYPYNPVEGVYQIGSPIFEKTTIDLESGQQFVITADHVNSENIYIQSATLNNQVLNRTFITHKELMNGGELHFVMGDKPNKRWGLNKN